MFFIFRLGEHQTVFFYFEAKIFVQSSPSTTYTPILQSYSKIHVLI